MEKIFRALADFTYGMTKTLVDNPKAIWDVMTNPNMIVIYIPVALGIITGAVSKRHQR